MHKVAVTGATGWIGRYVVARLLEKGYEVHATYRTAPLPTGGVWHQVNLLNGDEVIRFTEEVRPDSLIHLAWDAIPPKCYRSIINYEWTRSSMTLIHHFALNGGKRVVVAGTGAEYAWGEGMLSEYASPDSYANAYAASKNSLRIWLESYAEAAGFSAAWGRLFHMYGPHDPGNRLVASMIKALLNKQEAYCQYGILYRDYLYIEDAANALVALFESGSEGTVNIAAGHSIQLQQLVREIGSILGSEEKIRFGEELPTEPIFIGADISRLVNEVQWKPAYSLAEGLKRTMKWYADQAD
ncbi:Nucleoside-diphosphate-sugar epimerase [Paenibacillus catalpae]|uniref:Nucleoside-diphosphate-sugar epimerase n=1 Tax=Paenibacillus catalpae TaxID=1045775 RepID=A0A1I2C084_9BACL|nr:NAD(P)-dependent oxidoreductase [Paenibacillus catalpae]SFE61592.1 Nucleoside-diphosphate-sugar epimerase [Paenibacillus catalpae]